MTEQDWNATQRRDGTWAADDPLLPCPFCGSTNIDPEEWASIERKGPGCDDCGATADTIEIWNTRAALVGVQQTAISPSDPLVTIAGIRQFGLAPDGSDLRDLEAAFTRLALPHTGQQEGGMTPDLLFAAHQALAYVARHAPAAEQAEAERRAEDFKKAVNGLSQGLVERLRAALRPFSTVPPHSPPDRKLLVVDAGNGPWHLRQADFDNARAALSPSPASPRQPTEKT